eukprot:UN10837
MDKSISKYHDILISMIKYMYTLSYHESDKPAGVDTNSNDNSIAVDQNDKESYFKHKQQQFLNAVYNITCKALLHHHQFADFVSSCNTISCTPGVKDTDVIKKLASMLACIYKEPFTHDGNDVNRTTNAIDAFLF